MTAAEFRAMFPEFDGDYPTDALILQRLSEAEDQTSDYFTGSRRVTLVAYRAARFLALDPFGRDARLQSGQGATVYDARIDELVLTNGVRNRSY